MNLPRSTPPTLRVDALGLLGALALTAGALAFVVGPRFLSAAPAPRDQQRELEARRHAAIDVDRQAETAQAHLIDLNTQIARAVQLHPAEHINQRLVEITQLALAEHVSIAQMSPGNPAPAGPPTPGAGAGADKNKAPPSPLAAGGVVVVPIKLAGSGSYPEVARFLHALHDAFRDTAVGSLHITSQPGASENGAPIPAPFTIDLSWYAAPANPADPADAPHAP